MTLAERRSAFYDMLHRVRSEGVLVDDPLPPHDANGLPDLPHYRPYLGLRYAPHGAKVPLSMFEGELVVLWTLVAMLQPKLVFDLYTGTGLAAGTMAHALGDRGTVVTVDSFAEGNLGDEGAASAARVYAHLGAQPVQLRGVDTALLPQLAQAGSPDFAVMDGADWSPALTGASLRAYVLHDRPYGPSVGPHVDPALCLPVPGGSYMWIVAQDRVTREVCQTVATEVDQWLQSIHRAWAG